MSAPRKWTPEEIERQRFRKSNLDRLDRYILQPDPDEDEDEIDDDESEDDDE